MHGEIIIIINFILTTSEVFMGKSWTETLPYLPSIVHKNKPYNKYFSMVWP